MRFVILGEPVGKGRPRFSRKTGHAYTPSRTRSWEADAAAAMHQQAGAEWERPPKGTPMRLRVHAYFRRPDRLVCNHKRPHTHPDDCPRGAQTVALPHVTTPDADNLAKAVCDVLEKASLIHNDSAFCSVSVDKSYVAVGADACTIVEVTRA